MSRTAFSPGYHPDKKIRPKEISLIEEAAKKRRTAETEWRENVRLLSPTEINDLRTSMRRVQGGTDSAASVRAMRMIEVLDWFEDAVAQRLQLEKVIDGASEVTDALTELADNFANELGRDRSSALAEVFADAPENATREHLADLVGHFVDTEIEKAQKDIKGQIEAAQKVVAQHVEALEALSHVDEA